VLASYMLLPVETMALAWLMDLQPMVTENIHQWVTT